MQLTITPLAEAGVSTLPPDTVWTGTVGDFVISARPADGPVGGFRAANPLQTAVILCLFTDGRADPSALRFEHAGDRRGWPGDGFDVAAGEAPLGSTLWTYRREVLRDRTGALLAAEAERALQPLIAQGVAVEVRTKATVDGPAGRINLSVGLYGRNGAQVYVQQFDLLWKQADGRL